MTPVAAIEVIPNVSQLHIYVQGITTSTACVLMHSKTLISKLLGADHMKLLDEFKEALITAMLSDAMVWEHKLALQ